MSLKKLRDARVDAKIIQTLRLQFAGVEALSTYNTNTTGVTYGTRTTIVLHNKKQQKEKNEEA